MILLARLEATNRLVITPSIMPYNMAHMTTAKLTAKERTILIERADIQCGFCGALATHFYSRVSLCPQCRDMVKEGVYEDHRIRPR